VNLATSEVLGYHDDPYLCPLWEAGALARRVDKPIIVPGVKVPLAFAAILLVCLASLPPERCDENTAVEVRSIVVDNELGCVTGWQELIARGPEVAAGDAPTYLKSLCRRAKPEPQADRSLTGGGPRQGTP
jgi:hypothetical protein